MEVILGWLQDASNLTQGTALKEVIGAGLKINRTLAVQVFGASSIPKAQNSTVTGVVKLKSA